MPELPEIETFVRDLRRTVVGKTIVDVHAGQPKGINLPLEEFRRRVRGVVARADRHGKSAVLHLPEGELRLHMGLGGTARFLSDALWPAAKFFALRFAEDGQLAIDKVFMGHAHFVAHGERPRGEESGVDALDPALTAERFGIVLRGKPKATIKGALMDQSLFAGIGNSYSDEILVHARIHPARRVATLSDREVAAVYHALRDVLERAVKLGGEASWHDFQGRPGRFPFAVHGAQRCGVCGGPVETIEIGGRTGYFCPACQPAADTAS